MTHTSGAPLQLPFGQWATDKQMMAMDGHSFWFVQYSVRYSGGKYPQHFRAYFFGENLLERVTAFCAKGYESPRIYAIDKRIEFRYRTYRFDPAASLIYSAPDFDLTPDVFAHYAALSLANYKKATAGSTIVSRAVKLINLLDASEQMPRTDTQGIPILDYKKRVGGALKGFRDGNHNRPPFLSTTEEYKRVGPGGDEDMILTTYYLLTPPYKDAKGAAALQAN